MRNLMIYANPWGGSKGNRIICLHEIRDRLLFLDRMRWLQQRYEVVPLNTLLNENPSKRSVALTFDDGYASWVSNVLPVLEDLRLPATFFVCSGLLDMKAEQWDAFARKNLRRSPKHIQPLSALGLKEISQSPLLEIGGHTQDHHDFAEHETDGLLDAQVKGDKETIESISGQRLQYFAYPFGQRRHATDQAQSIIKLAGYKAALTIHPGIISNARATNFELPRDCLELHQPESLWAKWLDGKYDKLVDAKVRLYQVIGRNH